MNDKYRDYPWEGSSSDGYADSIESALNLYNREKVESLAQWIDSEIKVMWAKQKEDGIIEGWHGDGNFARTSILYCLWKTKGTSVHPWREDVVFGAVQQDRNLLLCLTANKDWSGKLVFDTPRHKTILKLPLDWPRINQFPEWFTVDLKQQYSVNDLSDGEAETCTGEQLQKGIALSVKAGTRKQIQIVPRL